MRFGLSYPGPDPETRVSGGFWLRRWVRRYGLLAAVVALAVLPLTVRGTSCGQDLDFHLQNWMEVQHAWQQGVVYPRWDASANFGAGEPRFVFYPPLSRMLGAALGSLLPWSWVPFAFVTLALLGSGWSLRRMAAEWMSEDVAQLAACLYVVNPYLLFVVYERGAMAELLAAMWMPLVVLYGLRRSERRSRRMPSFVALALVIAALWLTNAPAATMGCYLLAAVVAVTAVREQRWTLVGRAAAGTALALALAGFWLLPAIWEQRWVQIERALGPLMRVKDSFLFGYAPLQSVPAEEALDLAYHNQVLRTASWVGVALLAAMLLAALLARRQRSPLWMPLVAAAAAIAALQFRASAFAWRLLPEMRYLQFPWRWLLVLGMIVAVLAGLALRNRIESRRGSAAAFGVVLVVACGMALLAARVFWQPCDEEDNIPAQMAALRDGGFPGTDEYTPRDADNDRVETGLPAVRVLGTANAEESSDDHAPWGADAQQEIPASVTVQRWRVEDYEAVVTSPRPGYAVLRLLAYPVWRVRRNRVAVAERPQRDDGLLVIPVMPGVNRIEVRWARTPDAWAGDALSLAALAVTLAFAWKGRRRLYDGNFRYHDRNAGG